jgi:homoserine dehydrogenase
VHPTLIPAARLIANVEGAMNAVVVQGDAVGTTLYYGKGAGSEPTASAVIADLVDITRMHSADPAHRVPAPGLPARCHAGHAHPADRRGGDGVLPAPAWWPTRPACWPRITGILADNDISIDAVLQREAPRAKTRPT